MELNFISFQSNTVSNFKGSVFAFNNSSALCATVPRPPWALLIPQIPFARLSSITQHHIELAEKAVTWTSYFHRLQSGWQVAKLWNLPENPVKAKQVVKVFFISRGTKGQQMEVITFHPFQIAPYCLGEIGLAEQCLYISHPYLWIFLLSTETFSDILSLHFLCSQTNIITLKSSIVYI